MKIGMVVGEPSGDALAASLITALKGFCSSLSLSGILGPKLLSLSENSIEHSSNHSTEQSGEYSREHSIEHSNKNSQNLTNLTLYSLYPMERLTLMGFVEPLLRLPELFKIRGRLIQHFTEEDPPDLFIGVDLPDFNLGLERILKNKKIPTVHYISPTVWAWRQGRVKLIKKAVDLMLALFPFEASFYEKHQVPVVFTGHPFADQIPLHIDKKEAKLALGFSDHQAIIAILPGSRDSELKYLAKTYIDTAKWCYSQHKELVFLVPLVSEQHKLYFENLCMKIAPEVPIQIIVGGQRAVMAACDVALVTSGSATLEMMLHKKPMVVAYRMNPITYQIARRLVKVPYISQPNLLAGEKLVPEFIQGDVEAVAMGKALLKALEQNFETKLKPRFDEIHFELRKNASETAASSIVQRFKSNL